MSGHGSCICQIREKKLVVDPACGYHRAAAAAPMDHSIPWNCPTYWDGCNCARVIADLRAEIAAAKAPKTWAQLVAEYNAESPTPGRKRENDA